jgi:hypothetical protein
MLFGQWGTWETKLSVSSSKNEANEENANSPALRFMPSCSGANNNEYDRELKRADILS